MADGQYSQYLNFIFKLISCCLVLNRKWLRLQLHGLELQLAWLKRTPGLAITSYDQVISTSPTFLKNYAHHPLGQAGATTKEDSSALGLVLGNSHITVSQSKKTLGLAFPVLKEWPRARASFTNITSQPPLQAIVSLLEKLDEKICAGRVKREAIWG